MGMWLWKDQMFLGGILDFKTEGAGRRWRERWPSKIDWNWGKHCCLCWFGQKWPSNRIKNDSRIFEHPQVCSSSGCERGFGKEKILCMFVPHCLTPEHREDRVTSCQDIIAMADADKNFFNEIITGYETCCFACDTEKKRQSSEWVGETSPCAKKPKF